LLAVLGLSVSYLVPMFNTVNKLEESVSKYLTMLDLWQRIAELFTSLVGSVPSGSCSNLTGALVCTIGLPYRGLPGQAVPENVYLVVNGVASCIAQNSSMTITPISSTLSLNSMTILATLSPCLVTDNVVTLVVGFAAPGVIREGTTTVTLTKTNNVVRTITAPLKYYTDRNPLYYYKIYATVASG